jgi:hypothetical protein
LWPPPVIAHAMRFSPIVHLHTIEVCFEMLFRPNITAELLYHGISGSGK